MWKLQQIEADIFDRKGYAFKSAFDELDFYADQEAEKKAKKEAEEQR